MSLNNIDNILAKLYIIIGGISAKKPRAKLLTKQDHMFSKGIAFPHLIWVVAYSLVFLGFIPIEHPPEYVWSIVILQSAGFVGFIIIWYFICYSCPCMPSGDEQKETEEMEMKGEEVNVGADSDVTPGTIDHRKDYLYPMPRPRNEK